MPLYRAWEAAVRGCKAVHVPVHALCAQQSAATTASRARASSRPAALSLQPQLTGPPALQVQEGIDTFDAIWEKVRLRAAGRQGACIFTRVCVRSALQCRPCQD